MIFSATPPHPATPPRLPFRPGRPVFPWRTRAMASSASLLCRVGSRSARSHGPATRDARPSGAASVPSTCKILPLTKSRQGYGASSEFARARTHQTKHPLATPHAHTRTHRQTRPRASLIYLFCPVFPIYDIYISFTYRRASMRLTNKKHFHCPWPSL